jgi:hypothetical protein
MTEATQRKENTHNRACRVAQGPDPWTEVQWIVHGYRIGISQGSSLGGPGVFSQAPPRGPPFLPGQQLPGPGLPRLTHHPGPPPGWTRASSLDCSRLESLMRWFFRVGILRPPSRSATDPTDRGHLYPRPTQCPCFRSRQMRHLAFPKPSSLTCGCGAPYRLKSEGERTEMLAAETRSESPGLGSCPSSMSPLRNAKRVAVSSGDQRDPMCPAQGFVGAGVKLSPTGPTREGGLTEPHPDFLATYYIRARPMAANSCTDVATKRIGSPPCIFLPGRITAFSR